MRWLQWSTADLETGLGGVEVHARSLARELKSLGVDPVLSSDPRDLARDDFDVVHLHGSGYGRYLGNRRTTRVMTLHGTTLGRMAACGEWTWPGGYAAYAREVRGVVEADVVLSVQPRVSLYRWAKRLGKTAEVCWNGWDSGGDREALPAATSKALEGPGPHWLFVGRGGDFMKGADRIRAVLERRPEFRLFAAPGTGFEGRAEVFPTGRLSSSQVREFLDRGDGLLMPSRYEGHSLVVLEALAAGLVVLATPVGGVPVLPPVDGLETLPTGGAAEMIAALDRISKSGIFTGERKAARSAKNQALLPRWRDVAKTALAAVEAARKKGI